MITCLLLAMTPVFAAPPRVGDVVFTSGFDTEAERGAWSKGDYASFVPGYQGSTSLRIKVPADQAAGSHMVGMPIDLTPYRGCRLALECMAKAEGVTKPSQAYLGAKFMLHYNSADDGPFWANENDVFGDFDWKKLSFIAYISPDATGGELSVGLQDSSGTVSFDAIKVTVYKGPPPVRPKPPAHPGPVFNGHPGIPRLRGCMSPQVFRDEDMRVLGQQWHANVIRWQITRNWGKAGTDRDLAEYDHWLFGRLDELDRALVACRKYGLKVVIDMHSPPGGRDKNSELTMLHEAKYQDHFVELWRKIAQRYKGNPAVWGYDLVNEPVQNRPSPPGLGDYLGAQVRAAKAIREIDPKVPIFIEANDWDSPSGYRELEPVDVPNVIYEVHMYVPGAFTHQGVSGSPTGITYPGKIAGAMWNKEALRRVLEPVRKFQLAYNVQIYVGEFSAIRWAPGAEKYLSDCIDIFEGYGWDWTYHAFREWDGWSVECGSDPNDHEPTAQPTDRERLLLSWFARNVKPRM